MNNHVVQSAGAFHTHTSRDTIVLFHKFLHEGEILPHPRVLINPF
jgi:hypothetical protein